MGILKLLSTDHFRGSTKMGMLKLQVTDFYFQEALVLYRKSILDHISIINIWLIYRHI